MKQKMIAFILMVIASHTTLTALNIYTMTDDNNVKTQIESVLRSWFENEISFVISGEDRESIERLLKEEADTVSSYGDYAESNSDMFSLQRADFIIEVFPSINNRFHIELEEVSSGLRPAGYSGSDLYQGIIKIADALCDYLPDASANKSVIRRQIDSARYVRELKQVAVSLGAGSPLYSSIGFLNGNFYPRVRIAVDIWNRPKTFSVGIYVANGGALSRLSGRRFAYKDFLHLPPLEWEVGASLTAAYPVVVAPDLLAVSPYFSLGGAYLRYRYGRYPKTGIEEESAYSEFSCNMIRGSAALGARIYFFKNLSLYMETEANVDFFDQGVDFGLNANAGFSFSF